MTTVFFNEIHYENLGFDIKEGVEIAGPAGVNVDGWKIVIYDAHGAQKGELAIHGLLPNQQNGWGTLYIPVALPNLRGGNALALVNYRGEVLHFISWGGNITARDGPAAGRAAEHISKEETIFTPCGTSIQLVGTGNKYEDFRWDGPHFQTFGGVNKHQTFTRLVTPPAPVPVVPPPTHEVPPPVVPTPVAPSAPASPQVIQSIDLQVEKNRAAHHTDKIHAKEFFAIRRGQTFQISLVAPAEVTEASLRFTVYPETQNSYVINVGTKNVGDPDSEWFGYFTGHQNGATSVAVHIPGRAIVGQYTLSASGDGGKTWTPAEPIYILFNAWSKHDDVFLDDEAFRNEYVLNEDGFIWVGSYFNYSARPWSFSQFNTKSLQAALLLLQKIPVAERGDVVLVSRRLSALVNSNDDSGVLVGNWSSDFSGGTPPSAWTGSADILKEYLLNKQPVKYGQCWVYSGTFTTILRALGVPARSVTNFASAHDVPEPTYNRSVDKYFLADGVTEDTDKTNDSVWNFHVWNDAWFARRDLKNSNYTGWQAVDATPQERSDRKFQMGPVPISAVKVGEKGINYDIDFVYSEVNADEKYYIADGRGGYRLVRTITDSVGKNISTKAVGTNARQDITLEYKYKENSVEERASHGADQAGPIQFAIEVDKTTKLGKTIHARLDIHPANGSGTVNVAWSAHIITYTGKPVTVLAKSSATVKVTKGTSANVPFELAPETYVPQLKGTNGILFRAFVTVPETDQSTIVQQEFDFVADDIQVTVEPAQLKSGADGVANIEFYNPLQIVLHNLVLSVEGTDLTKVQRFKFPSVKPGETLKQQVQLHAWGPGKKTLIVLLDSDEINDLTGQAQVIVV
uniref:Transglutaminase n=1 Tax=Physarum polycephalum TaxID=5791 RepID=Q5KSV5_PHYPO|nr:transglutaminase [Physarum polycephalum]